MAELFSSNLKFPDFPYLKNQEVDTIMREILNYMN